MGRKAMVTAFRCFFIFYFSLFFLTGTVYASEDPAAAQKTFQEVYEYLRRAHISHPAPDQLINGAISGMIDSLGDPYTAYLTEEDLKEMTDSLDGEYGGIGVYLEELPDYPRVDKVFPGSPAMASGLRAGDKIIKVDGMDIKGWPLTTAVEKIKGPVETEVVLVVNRDGAEISFRLKRAIMDVPSTDAKIEGKSTGYIAISSFGAKTPDHFKADLNELLSQNIKGLVIDLRDNSGGYLNAALQIAELLAPPDSTILITKNYDGTITRHVSEKGIKTVKIPTVVLVNSQSASAAEILAGALQDNGIPLLGATTYGKGVAQSLIRMSTGGALKVTTTEYTTPKGRQVNKVGLKPDYQVLTPELQLPLALRMLEPRENRQVAFDLPGSEATVDGEKVLARKGPLIKGEDVYLPLRFTLEALGWTVSWNQDTGVISAGRGKDGIIFTADGRPFFNGSEYSAGDVIIEEGTAYIPLDLFGKAGYTVTRGENSIVVGG